MTTLSAPMAADLQRPAVLMFCAVQIELPDYDLRLLDGSGVVSFDGKTFTGRDDTYGVLGGVTEIHDGVSDEAPSLTLTLMPKTNAAMAALAAPAAQGSRVMIWVGDLDPATGGVIGDPDLWFIGETDVPTQSVDQNARRLEVTVNSILMRFLDADQGARLNNGFHQKVWPGEKGLQFVSSVDRKVPWGSDTPKSPITYPSPSPQGGSARSRYGADY